MKNSEKMEIYIIVAVVVAVSVTLLVGRIRKHSDKQED